MTDEFNIIEIYSGDVDPSIDIGHTVEKVLAKPKGKDSCEALMQTLSDQTKNDFFTSYHIIWDGE